MTDKIFDALEAPFSADTVKWRVGRTAKNNKNSAAMFAYVDGRIVMNRLDKAVGRANWEDSYTETVKGRIICTLTVEINGKKISRSDGAGDTQVEGEKGAMSDAFKRAAVKFGIGRYLYSIPTLYVGIDNYGKPTPDSQNRLTQYHNDTAKKYFENKELQLPDEQEPENPNSLNAKINDKINEVTKPKTNLETLCAQLAQAHTLKALISNKDAIKESSEFTGLSNDDKKQFVAKFKELVQEFQIPAQAAE